MDESGAGGASHSYRIAWSREKTNDEARGVQPDMSYQDTLISFQKGPIQEHGVNGVTQEALLAIVIDRLRSFQAGPFACDEDVWALRHLTKALDVLKMRTTARQARGVEGTHQR